MDMFVAVNQDTQGLGVKQVRNIFSVISSNLPADVLWGSFVTYSFLKRTPKDVCAEAKYPLISFGESCNQSFNVSMKS